MLHLLALQEATSTQSAEVTVSHMLSHQIETIVRTIVRRRIEVVEFPG